MSSPKFFRKPFAVQGDRVEIPDDLQPTGAVNFDSGWGFDYERNPETDPNAKDVERLAMNWLMGVVTENLRQYQTEGTYHYITPAQNNNQPYPYSKTARCLYNDGSGVDLYESLVENNTSLPTDATKWAKVSIKNLVPITRKIIATGDLTGGGTLDQDVTIGANFASGVPPSRSIGTTAPLTGGGPLSSDLTLKINASSAATANYVIQRDAAGRAKVAAPAAVDDIARKQEVDAAAGTATWAGVSGKPATYAPAAHNHDAGNITTGTLTVARGGTGQTTVQALRNSMGLGNTLGVLPVVNGGTGQNNVQALRNSMGLGNTLSFLPIANGGTASNSAAGARANLGVPYGLSMGNNGWYQFPGGLIIQWGRTAAETDGSASTTPKTITFPTAFPNACRQLIGGEWFSSGVHSGAPEIQFMVNSVTKTNFTYYAGRVYGANNGGTDKCMYSWIAIGN